MYRIATAVVLGALALGTATAHADDTLDALLRAKPAAHAAALKLPAPPRAQALVPVARDGEMRFLIDAASLSRASSTELRYTLVARSDHGADNVSYEALDCARMAWRVEALWQRGAWQRQPMASWIPIDPGLAGVHGALYDGELCSDGQGRGSVAQMLQRLRHVPRGAGG